MISDRMHGYAIVCVVFLSTAVSVGTAQYAFGLFILPLVEEFGWSKTAIGASLSFAAVGGLTAPVVGRAMDRYGARPILVISLTISGMSLLLRPLMIDLWHWYTLSFFQFVAFAGMTTLPTGKLVAAWFPQSRGRMLGIASMGNNFGGLTVPLTVAAVMSAASWRASFIVLGATCLVIAIAGFFIIRERPAGSGGTTNTNPLDSAGVTASEAMRTRDFYAVAAVITLGFFTYSTPLSHMLAHLQNKGMDGTSAALALTGLAAGGLLGKLVFGTLADRKGARVAVMANLGGQAVFAAVLASLDQAMVLAAVLPLFGIFMGGFGVVSTLLVQDTFGLRHFGAVMGLLNIGTVLAWGLGPIIAGLSVDWTGSYSAAFFVAASFFAFGVLAAKTLKGACRP